VTPVESCNSDLVEHLRCGNDGRVYETEREIAILRWATSRWAQSGLNRDLRRVKTGEEADALLASDARSTIIRCMPRTTIDLDAVVLRRLKERSRREGKTMGQLASGLLSGALRDDAKHGARTLEWTSQPMQARVDLDDKEAVRRILEDS
jgi:hypothetical protein